MRIAALVARRGVLKEGCTLSELLPMEWMLVAICYKSTQTGAKKQATQEILL